MTIFNARISVASENSLIVHFGDTTGTEVSDEISFQIQYVKHIVEQAFNNRIIELTPSYASLLISYDPFNTDHYAIQQFLTHSATPESTKTHVTNNESQLIKLPVYYGEEVGLDLPRIAELADITTEQVIERHQAQTYRVFTIGFAPGFGYLGQVDPSIATPRLSTPRASVPKGAVAIADRQTAVYPAESPGGWNIIGRCPTNMFNPNSTPVMPFNVGDAVQFYAISKDEFLSLGGRL